MPQEIINHYVVHVDTETDDLINLLEALGRDNISAEMRHKPFSIQIDGYVKIDFENLKFSIGIIPKKLGEK